MDIVKKNLEEAFVECKKQVEKAEKEISFLQQENREIQGEIVKLNQNLQKNADEIRVLFEKKLNLLGQMELAEKLKRILP